MFDIRPITSPRPLDCGATSLKMLLAYYGKEVSLETLTVECKTRLVGCSMLDIKRAANTHGLGATVWKMDAEEVVRQDRPSIVWWRDNHFCVCCGRDADGKVVICNPDKGRYRMSEGTFKSFYSGVALFSGEPEDLPEEPPEVSLTQEEYDDIMAVVDKAEEVFG